jgi:hypothetical protein
LNYATIGFGQLGQGVRQQRHRRIGRDHRDPEGFASAAAAIGHEIIPKTLSEAVRADIIFLAVRFESHADVTKALPTWRGKIIIDMTNALACHRGIGRTTIFSRRRSGVHWRKTSEGL